MYFFAFHEKFPIKITLYISFYCLTNMKNVFIFCERLKQQQTDINEMTQIITFLQLKHAFVAPK